MNVEVQIADYLLSISQPKRAEMELLHAMIAKALPGSKLWYLDGKDDKGKIVTNPNIGYGGYTIKYANGKTKEFYQVGLSANTSGISVYIMGINDKDYLPKTFGKKIGKADVTGYCIKFKSVKDISLEVLKEAIQSGAEISKNSK